jgi:hypothetical protein
VEYAHQWITLRPFYTDEWNRILTMSIAVHNSRIHFSGSSGGLYADQMFQLTGGRSQLYPVFASEYILFNSSRLSAAPIVENGMFAPDILSGPQDFLFMRVYESQGKKHSCQTNKKPYDLMVQAVLMIAHTVAPDALRYFSDGDRGDWEFAEAVVNNALGPNSVRIALT